MIEITIILLLMISRNRFGFFME